MSISIRSINKTFGAYKALEDVSLEVPDGSLTALLGPSGSGKTTLLRIVAGLEFADDGPGEILFHGQDVGCQVFHADVHVFQRSAVEFRSRDSFESGATGRAGGR